MKMLIFDSGPIISLTTNNLLWILAEMKKRFNGDFYLTESVKKELIDRPLATKKFKFEALQVEKLIERGVLQVVESGAIAEEARKLLEIANSIYLVHDTPMRIVQLGEMESLASALAYEADAFVLDERITRMLIERPDDLAALYQKRLHTKVQIDRSALKEFQNRIKHVNIIRSAELVTVAYELGILDEFLVKEVPNVKRELLDSVLWGVKLNGCAISESEIQQILKIAKR